MAFDSYYGLLFFHTCKRDVPNSNRFEISIRLKFSNLSMAINQTNLTKLDPTECQTSLQHWFEILSRTKIVMLGHAYFFDY